MTTYGRRLIPHVIDKIASTDPSRECFQMSQMPKTPNTSLAWTIVTFERLANAINRCSHQIIAKFGEPDGYFPTICYVGPNDACYLVFMVAAIKTGYKALFVSPRNPEAGQLRLLEETECHHVVFAPSHARIVQPWLQQRDMESSSFGTLNDWFDHRAEKHFTYNKGFDEAQWDPLVVLHTSGSTGFPKPITVRQGMLAIADAAHRIPDWQGMNFFIREWASVTYRTLNPMPLFHAAGLYLFIFLKCLKHAQVESVLLPPFILEEMSRREDSVHVLAKLSFVAFGGGTLARPIGDALVKQGVTLRNTIATTECFPFIFYWSRKPELWRYFVFDPDRFGCIWHKQGDEKYYEMFVQKLQDSSLQGYFYTFPEASEVSTKDLYEPHPEVQHHWAYAGRADNIIVLSTGEKLNPSTVEDMISSHPEVAGAIVVGSDRFQPAILVEPIPNARKGEAFLNSIWKEVVHANRETVAHGQIMRSFILVATTDQPFSRTGKGTIQRALTIEQYKNQIDLLYDQAEDKHRTDLAPLNIQSEAALAQSIIDLLVHQVPRISLEGDTDVFSAGLDSLQVAETARALRANLYRTGARPEIDGIKIKCIYDNATPNCLSRHILLHHCKQANLDDSQQRIGRQLYERFTQEFVEASTVGRPDPFEQGQTVILTGSTGMLGSYLLERIVQSPRVQKVICLNRSDDGGFRKQLQDMEDRGLGLSFVEKTSFYRIDPAEHYFGLEAPVYEDMLRQTDRIILNAWPVDFNMPLESFEPHIRGVRSFADFAARAVKRVAVVFVSSIGEVDLWDPKKGDVPEDRFGDLDLSSTAYGCSKAVGGLILQDASSVGEFSAAIVRVGQIAGAESNPGLWKRQELIPSLIASSLFLGALPSELGSLDSINWLPAERIATFILDIARVNRFASPGSINGYYHGVNPSGATWADLVPVIQYFYRKQKRLVLLPFAEWVEKLASSDVTDRNPGIKLIDHYRRCAGKESIGFSTKRAESCSRVMKESAAISAELLVKWMNEWKF
ncbi:Non-canonical non-ribosomal peptide synthetase [Apiospora saccharicola]